MSLREIIFPFQETNFVCCDATMVGFICSYSCLSCCCWVFFVVPTFFIITFPLLGTNSKTLLYLAPRHLKVVKVYHFFSPFRAQKNVTIMVKKGVIIKVVAVVVHHDAWNMRIIWTLIIQDTPTTLIQCTDCTISFWGQLVKNSGYAILLGHLICQKTAIGFTSNSS